MVEPSRPYNKAVPSTGLPSSVVCVTRALVLLCLLGCTNAEEKSIMTNAKSNTPNIFDLSEQTIDIFENSKNPGANRRIAVTLEKEAPIREMFFSVSVSSDPPKVKASTVNGNCTSFIGKPGFYPTGECVASNTFVLSSQDFSPPAFTVRLFQTPNLVRL